MKCPICGSEVRPSKKYPGKYLCDTCRKRFPASSVIDEEAETPTVGPDSETETLPVADDAIPETAPVDIDTPAEVEAIVSDDEPEVESVSADDDEPETDTFIIQYDTDTDTTTEPASAEGNAEVKPKKKKRPIWPLLLLIIIFLIIDLFAAVCTFFPARANALLKYFGKTTVQDYNEPENNQDYSVIYAIGDTAVYENTKMTVLGYEESVGDEWSAPAEGNIFVFVNMELVNNSEEEITVNSMASFESYCDDTKLNYSANAFTAIGSDTERNKMDGTLAKGESLDGWLCLEVPADWTSIEIHYFIKVWSDHTVKFQITK